MKTEGQRGESEQREGKRARESNRVGRGRQSVCWGGKEQERGRGESCTGGQREREGTGPPGCGG